VHRLVDQTLVLVALLPQPQSAGHAGSQLAFHVVHGILLVPAEFDAGHDFRTGLARKNDIQHRIQRLLDRDYSVNISGVEV